MLVALLALAPATSEGAGEGKSDDQVLALGRTVFLEAAEPQCALCHTLAAAGANAEVGPNLDHLKPDMAQVRKAVIEGVGVMPPFEDLLSPEQINAVSRYVAAVAGQAN